MIVTRWHYLLKKDEKLKNSNPFFSFFFENVLEVFSSFRNSTERVYFTQPSLMPFCGT